MGWPRCFENDNEKMFERIEDKGLFQSMGLSYWSDTFQIYSSKSEVKAVEKEEKPQYEDTYVVCRECGEKFFFSSKLQKYYDDKDWGWPRRCKGCREARDMRYIMYSRF